MGIAGISAAVADTYSGELFHAGASASGPSLAASQPSVSETTVTVRNNGWAQFFGAPAEYQDTTYTVKSAGKTTAQIEVNGWHDKATIHDANGDVATIDSNGVATFTGPTGATSSYQLTPNTVFDVGGTKVRVVLTNSTTISGITVNGQPDVEEDQGYVGSSSSGSAQLEGIDIQAGKNTAELSVNGVANHDSALQTQYSDVGPYAVGPVSNQPPRPIGFQNPSSPLYNTGVASVVGSFPEFSAQFYRVGENYDGTSFNGFGSRPATEIEPNNVTLVDNPSLYLGDGGLYMNSEFGYSGGELQPGALVQPGQIGGPDWSSAVNPEKVNTGA